MLSPRTQQETEQIQKLFRGFCEVLGRYPDISRQTLLDGIEYTLDQFLIEIIEDENQLRDYIDVMTDRMVGMWRRHQNSGS
jgi:hypothetical protein